MKLELQLNKELELMLAIGQLPLLLLMNGKLVILTLENSSHIIINIIPLPSLMKIFMMILTSRSIFIPSMKKMKLVLLGDMVHLPMTELVLVMMVIVPLLLIALVILLLRIPGSADSYSFLAQLKLIIMTTLLKMMD